MKIMRFVIFELHGDDLTEIKFEIRQNAGRM
jgi:hypothetical protein